jgi:hypothetical protein
VPTTTTVTRLNQLRAVTQALTNVPVQGTFPNGGIFAGTLDIERLTTASPRLVAVGRLSGVLVDAAGNVQRVTNMLVRLPVRALAVCPILHLELGPLDLDLLGLVVHLDRVVLDITAHSGPGRLLGNLLCALAGLLDNNRFGAFARQVNSNFLLLRLGR